MFNLTLKELRAIDNVEESDLKAVFQTKKICSRHLLYLEWPNAFKLPSIHPTSAKRLPHEKSIFFRKAHLKAW